MKDNGYTGCTKMEKFFYFSSMYFIVVLQYIVHIATIYDVGCSLGNVGLDASCSAPFTVVN